MPRQSPRWCLAAAVAVLLAGTAASSQSSSSITFQSPAQGWNVLASSNPLPFGSTAAIHYSADRLPQCRGDINGTTPGWTITGYYQFNNGPVQRFWVAGFSSTPNPPAPSIPLHTLGTLAVWFENTSRWGCQAWDSNFGNNHLFTVQ
ncbi:hypothetical protein HV824_12380 [Myxococcus sp. AM009]|uniref:DUF6209 family protein n=1 Tax=unclassified Myxococcus TaxID=2648731 RepID=UPI0015957DA4|nr:MULTISPECIES: DUF6209 family protein [unclassified Myxococcus]NVI98910.1 hypothetical protein [Myxococcus sp. AM009]NVJ17263.1 hypothetical protein [Myxococcus sp. AM010]